MFCRIVLGNRTVAEHSILSNRIVQAVTFDTWPEQQTQRGSNRTNQTATAKWQTFRKSNFANQYKKTGNLFKPSQQIARQVEKKQSATQQAKIGFHPVKHPILKYDKECKDEFN